MDTLVLCIIPSEPYRTKIRELMESTSMMVGSTKALPLPPHITLVGRFQTQQYADLLIALNSYLATLKPFILTIPDMGHFEKPAIIFLNVDKTPLQQLHEDLLELVKPFREPWVREALKDSVTTPRQQELVETYGSPFVMEYYDPHLTLAGPDVNEQFQKTIRELHMHAMEFAVPGIAILKKKELWQIVEELPFGN